MWTLLRILARPMIAAIFIRDGLDAVFKPDSHVERFAKIQPFLERLGLPPVLRSDAVFLSRLLGGVTTLAALGMALGRAPRLCAAVLAAANFPITIVNNPVWAASDDEERAAFSRGLLQGAALTGGLGMVMVDLQGKPSLGWKLAHRRSLAPKKTGDS
ncbi:MAG: DoxX family protein [Actinomycetaceae bacterium]|nr:DoxX family protein [Actinomycetaceae bacterium]